MKMLDCARSAKWKIAQSVISAMPFSVVKKVTRGRLVSFYYHVIADELPPHLSRLYSNVHSVQSFGEELDFLQEWFNPITAARLLSHLQDGEPLPKNPCLITFDDGYREVYEHAFPQLAQRQMSFVFFLTRNFVDNHSLFVENTVSLILNLCEKDPDAEFAVKHLLTEHGVLVNGPIERYLQRVPYKQRFLVELAAQVCGISSSQYAQQHRPYVTVHQVHEMLASGLVEVGGHSVDHPRNEELTDDEQVTQVADSMNSIEELFSPPSRLYAFPYSDASISIQTYQRLFRDLKIDLAFGTEQLRSSRNPQIVQRCWMDARDPGGPASKVSKLFQAEILSQWKDHPIAARG